MTRSRRILLLCAAAVVALVAWGWHRGDFIDRSDAGGPGVPEPPPSRSEAERPEDVQLEAVTVVDGGSPMTSMTVDPTDGSLLVAEIGGGVRRVRREANATGTTVPMTDAPLELDLSDQISTGGERGLLGVAFSPDGDRLYASWTDHDGAVVVASFVAGPDGVDPASQEVLLRVPHPTEFHNGGSLLPLDDGSLLVGVGDGGYVPAEELGDATPAEVEEVTYSRNAQDPSVLLGKLLRLWPDGDAPEGPFEATGGAPEVWAIGLRNPWRLALDPETGDLWVADVGDSTAEEVDLLPAAEQLGRGQNLGWDVYEGRDPTTNPGPLSEPTVVTPPVHQEANPTDGCSIIGGAVLRDADVPALEGAYLYTDLCQASLRALVPDGDGWRRVQVGDLQIPGQPTALVAGPDGTLYATTLSAGLVRLDLTSSSVAGWSTPSG